jgi:subtilisin-like proprotein convertase family protein
MFLETLEERQLLTVFSFFKGPNLAANATLSAAVDDVGQRIGGLFSDTDSNGDPLNIKVDIELSGVGAGLSTTTPSVINDMTFDAVRNLLVLDASPTEPILSQLPTSAQFSAATPNANFPLSGNIALTRANLQAIGVDEALITADFDSDFAAGQQRDMRIDLDNGTTYDADQSDGTTFGQIDFQGLVTRELLTGMGFASTVDVVDAMLSAGQSGPISPSTLDLFRLEAGAGAANFTTAVRQLEPGGLPVIYDGGHFDAQGILGIANITNGDIPVASGISDDGDLASRWKDDDSAAPFIPDALGVFEPTPVGGQTLSLSNEDTRVLGLIGWDVAQIHGELFNDLDGDGVRDAGEGPLEGWTVFVDSNGNGRLDTQRVPIASLDVPTAIPNLQTVDSDLVVTDFGTTVSDLTVTLDISHGQVGDLDIALVSPTGTRVDLASGVGGSGDDFTNTTFDSTASTLISDGTAPFTGVFEPEGDLTLFDGEAADGIWKLEITDSGSLISGSLTSWSIAMTGANIEPWTITSETGEYWFTELPNGPYDVYQFLPSDWVQTVPVGGNILRDGGFEVGTPNPFWLEHSDGFGTPLCDSGCGGAEARTGEFWAWFGGTTAVDESFLEQTLTIPSGNTELQFYLQIREDSGNGQDFFEVLVDGVQELRIDSSEEFDYFDYTLVTVDLSSYADGAQHSIRLRGELFGGGQSSFYVDDVELISAGEAAGHSVTVASDSAATGVDFGSRIEQPDPGEIHGNLYYDFDQNQTRNGVEPGLESWEVYLDQNNNGIRDEQRVGFVGSPFVANDAETTLSSQGVSGLIGAITDLNVVLLVDHAATGQLDAHLISPAGTRVELFTGVGGNTSNFILTSLDDEAATSITTGTGPFEGSYQPEGSLADFDGENANGVWSLEVADSTAGTEGWFFGWALSFSSGELELLTQADENGDYSFLDVRPDTYDITPIPAPGGWIQTTPLDSGTEQVSDGGFELGRNNPNWVETSTNFPSPICNPVSCLALDGTNGPRNGLYWLWFGGTNVVENGSASQLLTIPSNATDLSLHLQMPAANGSGNDVFEVLVDGNVLFTVNDGQQATYEDYTEILVDVSGFADDLQHTVLLRAITQGGNITSFFVDDVSLIAGPPQPTPIEIELGNAQIVQNQDFGFWTPNEGPEVASVDVNTDQIDPPDLSKGEQPTSWAQQRAMVRTIIVTFNEDVTADETGFRLTNLGLDPDNDPDTIVTILAEQVTVVDDVVTLLFDGDNVLEQGVYQLDVLPTIVDIFGAELDGDGNGVGGDEYSIVGALANKLYALTAEWNGDGGVSVFDFSTFSYWFGEPVAPDGAPHYVDSSGDGGVSVFDFSGFSGNFGKASIFPTAFAAFQILPAAPNVELLAGEEEVALIRNDEELFGELARPAARQELDLAIQQPAAVDQALMDLLDFEL